jgi:hypothetical protein
MVVITARDLAVRDVSIAWLRRVFVGDITEAVGKRLIPFNYLADDPLRRRLDGLVLQMVHAEVGRYWVDRRIRGQGMPPRIVPSAQIMNAIVAKLPGAIGYVAANQRLNVHHRVLTVSLPATTFASSAAVRRAVSGGLKNVRNARRARGRMLSALACIAASMLLSCEAHVPDGVFGCDSEDGCPSGLVCSLRQQRCVYDVSSDAESVTAGSGSVESGRAAVSGAGRGGASPGGSRGQASGGAMSCAAA